MFEALEPALIAVCIRVPDAGVEDEEERGRYHNGQIALTTDTGATYEGQCQNGLMHGNGIFVWPNGVKYTGEFICNSMTGEGVYEWPNMSKYSGQVLNGKRHGVGVFENAAGQVYSGEWMNGQRCGRGLFYYDKAKNVYYDGYWRAGMRSGFGIMHYASGNVYQGEWREDMKSGRGIMHWQGQVYIGGWELDKCHGEGEHFLEGNEAVIATSPLYHMNNMYRGGFRGGKKHGFGTFFYSDGSQYSGGWLEDKKEDLQAWFRTMEGEITMGAYADDQSVHTASPSINTKLPSTSSSPGGLKKFTSYYHLNILDALSRTLGSINYLNAASNPSADIVSQLDEVERIALRFDTYLKAVYRHYKDKSNLQRVSIRQERTTRAGKAKAEDVLSSMTSDITSFLESQRCLSDQLYCLAFSTFLQFLRDSRVIGDTTDYFVVDVQRCVVAMQEQQNTIASSLLLASSPSSDAIPVATPKFVFFMKVEKADEVTADFGLTERDFTELYIRCLVDKLLRTADLGSIPLPLLLKKVLVEEV